MNRFHFVFLFAFVVCCCFAGCQPDTGGRQKISGTVLFGGVPMAQGSISFQPMGDIKSSAGADIVKGQFHITGEQGLIPGEYSVVFTCQEPTGQKIKGFDADGKPCEIDEMASWVPLEYSEATTQQVTVVEGKNVFEFNVPRSEEPVKAPSSNNSKVM